MTGQPPEPPLNADQKRLEGALSRVRALCKGNGVKADSIRILHHTLARYTLNAGTYLELKPVTTERSMPGRQAAGQGVPSREEAVRQVDQAMLAAARNPATQAQIASVLLNRPDKGFGLNRQAVPLDFLRHEFSWTESCPTCRGSARTTCQACGGRRTEPCQRCAGRGLMLCPLCRGAGLLQGAKCTRCFGQRYVPCDGCQRSGMMPCRVCAATGTSTCAACGGQGAKTHVLNLTAQALTYFEYDGKSIPKGAADMIETQGAAMAQDGRIQVKGRIADEKENVLGANYEVAFSFGEITFALGKKEVKAQIFGEKGDIVQFPLVLDKMMAAPVAELEEAARDVGSVAAKIKSATRYRLIAQAFLASGRMREDKVAAYLLKLYDIGLSAGMAQKIAHLADATTAQITKKPRWYGFALGLGLSTLLVCAIYLSGMRVIVAGYLPDARFDIVIDIIPLVLGGVATGAAVQMSAAGAMKKALGHLLAKGGVLPALHKAGGTAIWAYPALTIFLLALLEYMARTGKPVPFWFGTLRGLIF
jgi:hypothetical protein